jgi:outer membrane beta-barrel protein
MVRIRRYEIVARAIVLFGIGIGININSFGGQLAFAEDTNQSSQEPKKIEVQKLRQDYWEGGEKSESEVIQNRAYTKAHSFELNALGGVVFSDPFLANTLLGARIAYNISDTWAIHAMGWKDFVSPSDAANTFAKTAGYEALTNPPDYFYGLGVDFTPIYGKLSFFGSYILHYDLGINAGAGVTGTSTGNDFTPYVGLSQKIYLTSHLSIGLDYHLMAYSENIPVHDSTTQFNRVNWSNVITLNLGVFY